MSDDIAVLISAILEWQSDDFVHPLTCGNNSNHANLMPFVIDNEVKLNCLDCDYVQTIWPALKTMLLKHSQNC